MATQPASAPVMLDAALERRIALRAKRLIQENGGSILSLIGRTPLMKLADDESGVTLHVKLEGTNPSGSLKDRTVLYLIADGIERELIREGTTLVEGTSGNTGIALAAIGAALGYPVHLFMPDNVSEERQRLMAAYGATVTLTPGELGTDGAIDAARELGRTQGHHWLAQHENPANALAHYETMGAELLDECPEIDAFVAPSGTTGTLMGVARRLKEADKTIEIVAVWPEVWIMGLRRPEGSKRPGIYDDGLIDRIVEVSDEEAKEASRILARAHGLFVGPSSGAAWVAAKRLAAERSGSEGPRSMVACFPDEGSRYLSTDTFSA